MSTRPRAHYAAADVLELERRNDFSAKHEQAMQAFVETVFFWHPTEGGAGEPSHRKAYRLPDGTHTGSVRAALDQWGNLP